VSLVTEIDREQRRIVRAFLWVGLVAPAIFTVVAMAIAWSWRDELPDPVATHWGPGGAADGFGSLETVLIFLPLLALGLPALLIATAFPALRRGNRGPNFRLLASVAAGLSVMLSVLLVGSLAIQRGLADAADAPSIGPVLLWAYGLAVVAGVVGWFVQPKQETRRDPMTPGAEIVVAPGERVVWVRSVAMRGWFTVLMFVLAVALGAFGVAILPESQWVGWLLIAVAVFIGGAAATMTSVSVTVNEHGLTVRGGFGWPSTHVPLEDIESAEVATINGMADFGGWGWRLRPGAKGIVLRDGDGIWVKRRSTRDFAVTVDDAATGAGLLTALAARARAQDGPN
jgi:hypothetical protein